MSKKKFYVLQSDADTLPAEMKGIYTGDEFPEYKGAETITFNNKTYINGLDYQTVKSGKHVRIEECPICNRLSIIYARGVCKACAQRTLYRHRRDKTGDVMTERNIREANIAFRKGWPVNIIAGWTGSGITSTIILIQKRRSENCRCYSCNQRYDCYRLSLEALQRRHQVF